MPHRIEFDWDPVKATSNLSKHRVTFDEAMTVFADKLALSKLDDDTTPIEERWATIGMSASGRLLVVVHTHVDATPDLAYVRIISARTPTKRERQHYEQAPNQG